MNEPAIRTEEQIISLFPDRETQVCRGWVLKRMEGQLLVYPLYYKFSEGDIPENVRRCEEISRQCGAVCVPHRGAYQLPPEFHPYGQWVRDGKMRRGR